MNLETVQRAVLLVDMVDSVGLNEALGDLEFARLMVRFESAVRELIRRFEGREIDKTDGFLVVFSEPLRALEFALALPGAVGAGVRLRTGLHYGTLILRENAPELVAEGAKAVDADGLTKVIAARITGLAEAGQVLITRALFDFLRADEEAGSRIGGEAMWLAHGAYLLQGLQEPVEIFEVGYPGSAPLAPPGDKGKARRAILPQNEFALGWRPANGQAIPTAPDFTVTKKLGEGGYGEVWLAEHRQTRERRVFKFCFDPGRMRSLNREKMLLTALQENLESRRDIVRIVDWNVSEAPYFIALEYIPAVNLMYYLDLREGRGLKEELALGIIRKAAVALAAAHSVGVLHKDIKPSNLLVGGSEEDPDVYLIDFGIGLYSKPEGEDELLSTPGSDQTTLRTSSFSGSRMYIAPEVIEGKLPTVQADLFSLGVMLYQLLRDDRETGLKVGWERDIADPLLADLVASATDGDLDKRLRSVPEFIARLDSLEERRAQAHRAKQAEAERRRVEDALAAQKRRRRFYAVALAIAIPLSLISIGLAVQARRASGVASAKALEAARARERGNDVIAFMLQDLSQELKRAGQLPLMDSVTSHTLKYYESESTASLTTEEVYNRGRAFYNLGEVFFNRSKFEDSRQSHDRALEIGKNLMAQQPGEMRFAALYADAAAGKASAVDRMRKFPERDALLEEAYRVRKEVYKKNPDDVENAKKFAENHLIQASNYARTTTGTHYLEEAIPITSRTVEMINDPIESNYWQGINALKIMEVTNSASDLNYYYGLAKTSFQNALRLDAKNFLIKQDMLDFYSKTSFLYLDIISEDKLDFIRKGIALADELLEKDPSNYEWRRLAADIFQVFTMELQSRGLFEESLARSRQASTLVDEMFLDNPNDYKLWFSFWGNRLSYDVNLRRLGYKNDIEPVLDQTSKIIRRALEKEPNLSYFIINYACSCFYLAMETEDKNCFDQGLKFIKQIDSETSITFRKNMGLGKFIDAWPEMVECDALWKKRELKWIPVNDLETSRPLGFSSSLSIKNNTSETVISKIFPPQSLSYYECSFIPVNSIANRTRVDNLNIGLSINDSEIVPLWQLIDPEKLPSKQNPAILIMLNEFLDKYGDSMQYRIGDTTKSLAEKGG